MRRQALQNGAVLTAVLLTAACSHPQLSSAQGGSIALSADGTLFVAASDNGGVAVVDPNASSGAKAFIATGDRPEQLILRGASLFVSNRQSRTVTQIDAASHSIVRQISAGSEPMGMDVTDDGLLLIANAMSGTIQAVGVADGNPRWTVTLNDDIRAVVAVPGGRAYAPAYKSGVMYVLDTQTGTVLSGTIDISATRQAGFEVRGVESALFDPVDGFIYLPHSESNGNPLSTSVDGTIEIAGSYALGQQSSTTTTTPMTAALPSVGAAMSTVSTSTRSVSPLSLVPATGSLAQPKVSVLSSSREFIYTAGFLSNNVGITSRAGGSPILVGVGQGPNGIAIAADDKSAYVYNSFDHSIDVIGQVHGQLGIVREISGITPQTLTPAQQHGRILFHSATDPRLSDQSGGGIACASCHPAGREDGHTWSFAEGVRNTPALVGRHLELTAPYHWDGSLNGPSDFNSVVQVRMGGTGLQPDDYADIFAWIESEPAPDNPYRSADGTLTPDQTAGAMLFGSSGCAGCHVGAALTDNLNWNVGTAFTTAPLGVLESGSVPVTAIGPANANTPSLLGVFASAPYLHDGSKQTLRDRLVENPGDLHGRTSALSDTQISQLVSYLQTL